MMKYIIFDFDGTLADSKNVFVAAWNQLANKHRFKKVQHEDLDMLRGLSIKERSKRLNFPMYKIPIVVPEMYRLYRQSLQDVTLFDGMKHVLRELMQRGYGIVIISSNSEDNIREFLKRNEIRGVKEVLCSRRIFGKDQVIRKFLQAHHLKESEVMYVGDECRDIAACQKSRIKIIWVGWGYDAKELAAAEGPDYMAAAPEEILDIVSQIQ